MRLVFAGTPEVAAVSLRALLDSHHEVVGVVTRPDAPSGRGRGISRSSVAELALEHGLPILQPESARAPEFAEQLRLLAPDCCPVVAYGALLPTSILEIPAHGWVNLHFSLLPAWRGAAPVQSAILHGDEITGATTFLLDEGMDTGPILGVMTESISPADTSGALLERLAHAGAGLLVSTLDALESGSLIPQVQAVEGVCLAPKLTVDDARVRWDQPAIAIDRRIRACTPAPGAWTTLGGDRVKLGPITLGAADVRLAPGRLAVTKSSVAVGTATGTVILGDVQAMGKRAMPAADWARGLRLTGEESFA